jgi:hypothetical protein
MPHSRTAVLKINLSLYLINYAMLHEDVWRSGGIAPTALSSAQDGMSRQLNVPVVLHQAPPEWEAGWVPEPLWASCSLEFNLWYRLYGLVVRVPGYRSRGWGSIPGATRFSEK